MKCPSCKGENLIGRVTIVKMLPMAQRGGSVKVGGSKISQVDLKNAWDKTGPGKDKDIRGPIWCSDCDQELFYVSGAKDNPYKGSYKDAERVGAEHFIEGGTLEGNE